MKRILLLIILLVFTLPAWAQQTSPTPTPSGVLICAYGQQCPPFAVMTATLPAQPTQSNTSTPIPTATLQPTNTPTPAPTNTPVTIEPSPTGEVIPQGVAFVSQNTNNPVTITALPPMTRPGVQVYYIQQADQAKWDALGVRWVRIDICGNSYEDQIIPAAGPNVIPLLSVDRCNYNLDSDAFAKHVVDVLVKWNITKGRNIRFLEVDNEPDYAPNGGISPATYASAFKKVVDAVRAYPDARVNTVWIGGPTLGSGDPIDGGNCQQGGYANKTSNRNHWREFIPLIKDRANFLTWHDYGEPGVPDKNGVDQPWGKTRLDQLDQICEVVNRVNAFSNGLPVIISENNWDAGWPLPDKSIVLYQKFFTALWRVSLLNNYASTGKVIASIAFDWKSQKGLLSGGGTPQPVYYAYQQYVKTAQARVLASQNGLVNPWTDAVVTISDDGNTIGMIVVNKAATPQNFDFSFNVPVNLAGTMTVNRILMQAGGQGEYGSVATPPVTQTSSYSLSVVTGKQLRYTEVIPPQSIVFYTLVRKS